ncbi:MAG: sulfite exporter TauE/SafE family protein [Caldilineae bacterium]|nr:MAG: sulfite exporter TauE/SafE family protein [Caldilineae bacterium]
MDPLLIAAVIAAGFAAGFINTLAGSGSAITLPLLVFMGLPANVANGTNRIGVLFQTTVSSATYHREGVMPWRDALFLLVPAIVGGVAGAAIAVDLDETAMRRAIGAMLILSFFLILLRPKRWLVGRPEGARRPGIKEWILFFFVGMYGGFIQAGVGIFMLVGLVMVVGHSLVRANAIKALLVLALNIFALVVFLRNGQVNWVLGLVLAVGNIFGGWAAARMATRDWAQVWVYRLLLVVVVVAAVRMFLT